MKLILSLLAISSIGALAQCQEAVQLGQTQPIDLKVTNVNWHPTGNGFIYTREQESGIGFGVFAPGKFAGKVVLEFKKTPTYSIYWFRNQASALLQVQYEVPDKPASTQVQIFLIDAEAQTAKQVFGDVYDTDEVPYIAIDTSPLLKHAIVKLSFDQEVRHLVLCQNANSLANSSDLDRAVKQGMQGPSWSIDGTAVYGENKGKGEVNISGVTLTLTNSGQVQSTSDADPTKARLINAIAVESVVSTEGLSLITRRLMPIPEVGSSVYELMPSNPILRPVKFRGPWATKSARLQPLSPQNQQVVLHYGNSSQQDHSVWLRRGKDPSAPATLLAVHASKVWIDVAQKGVVYLIDGALFFRTIN